VCSRTSLVPKLLHHIDHSGSYLSRPSACCRLVQGISSDGLSREFGAMSHHELRLRPQGMLLCPRQLVGVRLPKSRLGIREFWRLGGRLLGAPGHMALFPTTASWHPSALPQRGLCRFFIRRVQGRILAPDRFISRLPSPRCRAAPRGHIVRRLRPLNVDRARRQFCILHQVLP